MGEKVANKLQGAEDRGAGIGSLGARARHGEMDLRLDHLDLVGHLDGVEDRSAPVGDRLGPAGDRSDMGDRLDEVEGHAGVEDSDVAEDLDVVGAGGVARPHEVPVVGEADAWAASGVKGLLTRRLQLTRRRGVRMKWREIHMGFPKIRRIRRTRQRERCFCF